MNEVNQELNLTHEEIQIILARRNGIEKIKAAQNQSIAILEIAAKFKQIQVDTFCGNSYSTFHDLFCEDSRIVFNRPTIHKYVLDVIALSDKLVGLHEISNS